MTEKNRYEVRYYCGDGEVLRIPFMLAASATASEIVAHGAGLLFVHDCCPDEEWAVYWPTIQGPRNLIEVPSWNRHRYYGDDDRLWPKWNAVRTVEI